MGNVNIGGNVSGSIISTGKFESKVKEFNPLELGFIKSNLSSAYKKDNKTYLYCNSDGWSLESKKNGVIRELFQNCTIKSHQSGIDILRAFGVID